MLILECVKQRKELKKRKKKKKGTWNGRMARMGHCPFFGLCRDKESLSQQGFLGTVSRQAIPCCDRVRR